VRLAHQAAIENELITADAVEVSEFPHLAQKYRVMGVPKTVINEDHFIEGAGPEEMLCRGILEAIKAPT
jgi:predicted DsbA family dithiol-disulfide isomerase